MECKTSKKETPACIDVSWEARQARTLNSYKETGNINALRQHVEYVEGLGFDVNMIIEGGYFRVTRN